MCLPHDDEDPPPPPPKKSGPCILPGERTASSPLLLACLLACLLVFICQALFLNRKGEDATARNFLHLSAQRARADRESSDAQVQASLSVNIEEGAGRFDR